MSKLRRTETKSGESVFVVEPEGMADEVEELPPCDQCGETATGAAVDCVSSARDGWLISEPAGSVKYGCDDHSVESVERDGAADEVEAEDCDNDNAALTVAFDRLAAASGGRCERVEVFDFGLRGEVTFGGRWESSE